MSRDYLVLACLSLSLWLALPSSAWAHARLVKSIPAKQAVLAQAPTQIQLWFNEPLEARFSQVSVWNAAGQQVHKGAIQGDPQDTKKLIIPLPALDMGLYTVKYRVLSVDSHLIENQFSFTVQPQR